MSESENVESSYPSAPQGAYAPGSVIGVIGGGQLAGMMAPAAARLGYKFYIYSDQTRPCATDLASKVVCGSYFDVDMVQRFARDCAVVTFDFEHVPDETFAALEGCGVPLRPGAHAVHVAKNRLREKNFALESGLRPVDFEPVYNEQDVVAAYNALGGDVILKTVQEGYDGKGQISLKPGMSEEQLIEAFMSLRCLEAVCEKRMTFEKEISVLLARGVDGSAAVFPVPENSHRDGILRISQVPAAISRETYEKAVRGALTLAERLEYVGVMAVEYFVTPGGEPLFNEFAPRPHNSGHWSIDVCMADQFEQHIRAIVGLPLGDPTLLCPAVMTNILGPDNDILALGQSGGRFKLHLYGKNGGGVCRKNGHVTELLPG